MGIICFSESTFVVTFGSLEMFSVLSQQQTDTQERMEERQPGLVTSEGEASRTREEEAALRGSMTLS